MKKITCLVTILTIILSVALSYADDTAIYLTLEEIRQQAVINNKQIGLDDFNIKAKQSALNKAKENAKWLGDAFEPASALNNKIVREVNIMEAASTLEAASRSKVVNINNLKLNSYKQGLNLLLLNKQIGIESKKLEILKESLKIAQAKLKSGKITENDLTDIEYDIDNKQNDILSIREQIKTVSLKLKNLLNLELNDSLIMIKDELTYQPLDSINIDNFIYEAVSNSVEIYTAEEKVKAEQKRVELTALYYKQGDSTYDSNVLSLETAKLDLETAKTNMIVSIRNKYNDLLNQKAKVDIAEKYFQLCEKKLANLQVKYKKGVISYEVVLSGKQADIYASYQKILSIYEYNILAAEFLNQAGK